MVARSLSVAASPHHSLSLPWVVSMYIGMHAPTSPGKSHVSRACISTCVRDAHRHARIYMGMRLRHQARTTSLPLAISRRCSSGAASGSSSTSSTLAPSCREWGCGCAVEVCGCFVVRASIGLHTEWTIPYDNIHGRHIRRAGSHAYRVLPLHTPFSSGRALVSLSVPVQRPRCSVLVREGRD